MRAPYKRHIHNYDISYGISTVCLNNPHVYTSDGGKGKKENCGGIKRNQRYAKRIYNKKQGKESIINMMEILSRTGLS